VPGVADADLQLRCAEVWKFEPDIFRALRYDLQPKSAVAVAVDPGQMVCVGHAMRHTLQINPCSVLD
jgi:TATA-box binding protein (TBP) (component of TFIID and TFIIIB)